MGYCGPVVDLDKFKEGFQRTISRGPDDSRIVDTGNGLLGFHRLAIMGINTVRNAAFPIGWKLRGLQRRNLWI